MFRVIEDGSHHDYDEDLCKDGVPKYVGKTPGCGCCQCRVVITPETIAEHIRGLEEALDLARAIQSDVERGTYK
jgi:hypothetical protein